MTNVFADEPFRLLRGMIALFGLKNDVLALRQGPILEEKYTIRQVESESVWLEDALHHNTAILSLGKK
ncbi:MAG: hypothetical protein AB1714_21670 [Acidobacteriota bacterium]